MNQNQKSKNLSKEEILEQIQSLVESYCEKSKEDIIKQNLDEIEASLAVEQSHIVSNLKKNYIVFNVGGKLFPTTLATLKSVPDSRLNKIVTGRHPIQLDDERNIFIDRNPDYFPYILEYIRDGSYIEPQDAYEKKRVLAELQYFGLQIEKKFFKFDKQNKDSLLNVSQDALQAYQSTPAANVVLGDREFTSGVYEWTVDIVTLGAGQEMRFGVCDKSTLEGNLAGFHFGNLPHIVTSGSCPGMQPTLVSQLMQGDKIKCSYNCTTKTFKVQHQTKGINSSGTMSGKNIYPFFYLYGSTNHIKLSFE